MSMPEDPTNRHFPDASHYEPLPQHAHRCECGAVRMMPARHVYTIAATEYGPEESEWSVICPVCGLEDHIRQLDDWSDYERRGLDRILKDLGLT